MESTAWLSYALSHIPVFVKQQQGSTPGFYRYSVSGDLFGENTHWGLTSRVFATKILYMVDRLDETTSRDLISRIKTFENNDGSLFDPLLVKKSFLPSLLTSLRQQDLQGLLHHTQMLKRAETRQSTAALFCLGSSPTRPYRGISETSEELRRFLRSLSWHLPWNAGSHVSHVLFFLHHNHRVFGLYQDSYQELLGEIRSFLSTIQSPTDGFWYRGSSVSMTQKINGAMKVLTGLMVIEETSIPFVEKIIDTTLSHPSEEGACCSIDALYVLWACSRKTAYRHAEIERYALHKISEIKEYYQEESGGFSFYRGRTNARIYGAKVTSGKNEADLHGSVLYVWGLVMIAEILGMANIPYRQPIT
ncbi:hypothetical protein HY626_02510 [Candidatus Uhrbacteria bacterium]|nr:hypothetical protein [Candidatus Uhrbacteria bacterium]